MQPMESSNGYNSHNKEKTAAAGSGLLLHVQTKRTSSLGQRWSPDDAGTSTRLLQAITRLVLD
eukprot:714872-Pelagomonas_calceolata.AAC.4